MLLELLKNVIQPRMLQQPDTQEDKDNTEGEIFFSSAEQMQKAAKSLWPTRGSPSDRKDFMERANTNCKCYGLVNTPCLYWTSMPERPGILQ